VYLVYSKDANNANSWIEFTSGQGQLELAPSTLEIVAGAIVEPKKDFGFPETPLGQLETEHEAIVLPIKLSSLDNLGSDGEVIYFQAIAIPLDSNEEYDWSQAQASEVDSFSINYSSSQNTDYGEVTCTGSKCSSSSNGGSTTSSSGSKTSSSGSKTSSSGSKTSSSDSSGSSGSSGSKR